MIPAAPQPIETLFSIRSDVTMKNQAPVRSILAAALALALQPGAHAADSSAETADGEVFKLGQITVTGKREKEETAVGTATLSREQLWNFTRDGLPDALNLVPGVVTTAGAGNRNESAISIRGFDRWQVPLLMDGIRLYLPADNRIDFDRFLTPDLSEIQVSKGYVSVLNGPDGLGGSINLVTRKPVKAFEAEVRASGAFSSDLDYNGSTLYANIGSRQEKFYVQTSVEQRDVKGWYLSKDFTPTVAEDGGERDHTSKKDWRVNVKAGFTPNATDEYSLNYVYQSGEKHGIGAVTGTSAISTWDWPKWDTSSLYWLSNTQLDGKTYLKTRAYYNKFVNDLVAFTNVSLTTPNWTSYYDDNARGASVEVGTDHLPQQTLKAAIHYRRDEHSEWQRTHARTGVAEFVEPKQYNIENVVSLALEDTWHATDKLDLVAGISHDKRSTSKAEDWTAATGLFDYPTADNSATNYQGAAIYRYSTTGKAHFAVSNRTRFANVFERFSSRFGGATSNPWLEPERALNIELGIADEILPGLRGEAAVFHNRVKDVIQSVTIPWTGGTTTSQSQNVGDATYKGLELALTYTLSTRLDVGGNYSYVHTEVKNPNDPNARLTTTPRNKALAFARWRPLDGLLVLPSVEYADARWSTSATTSGAYVKTGQYVLANVKLEYQVLPGWDLSLTARNLFDRNYAVSDGYPQEGRNFVVGTRYQF